MEGLKNKIKMHIPDKEYIQWRYFRAFHKLINFRKPATFNEKLNWLKIYDRNPEYTTMVDKYAVKRYVAQRVGEEYVIPAIGGPWKDFYDIDFDMMPEQFVLKTNHDCGGVVVCKDKKSFDKGEAHDFLNMHLKRDYYLTCREWPYKNVNPIIFAEQYMKDGDREFLPVYKFMCFNGEPKIIQTIQNDKQPNESIDYFDPSWNLLKMKQNFPNSERPLKRPVRLDEMLKIAKRLSEGMSFVRVDLYEINQEIKFSEFTFYSDAGFEPFHPSGWDERLGAWMKLPSNNRNTRL